MKGQVQNWNVDRLFDELENNALPKAYGFMQDYANTAQQEGLELIAYEGGVSTLPDTVGYKIIRPSLTYLFRLIEILEWETSIKNTSKNGII